MDYLVIPHITFMHPFLPFCSKKIRNALLNSPCLAFTLTLNGSFPLIAIQHFNDEDVAQVDVVFTRSWFYLEDVPRSSHKKKTKALFLSAIKLMARK